MRTLLTTLLAVGLVAPAFACGEAKSERCQQVCQMETDCAEKQSNDGESMPYDLEECVDACVNLERDSNNRKTVDEHVRCAKAAGNDCAALMSCR